MKVTIAEHAGFCFGVERAIKIVESEVRIHDHVATFGPIIHNPQVVQELSESGVDMINSIEEVAQNMSVVVRTHGIPKTDYNAISEKAKIVDATCPFVKKVQEAAYKLSNIGITTIVVGEINHPEVQGIVSYIDGEYYVINSVEEARELPEADSYGVVAQTTQNIVNYNKITAVVAERCKDIKTYNTICSATYNRQKAAEDLAKKVDAMIIVGGKNSANTSRLYQICLELCPRAYHIETEKDLTDSMLSGVESVGISAGASTPLKLVHQVKEYILERAK